MTPTESASGPATRVPATWDRGWYRAAQRLDSPNFGPRPPGMAVDLVVLHSISLPPGEFGGMAVPQLFTNTLDWDEHPYFQQIRGLTVSAHFFIRRDGSLVQFVSCDDRAWHAGASCHQGRDNCNDYSIGIEFEGLEGGLFEPVQYRVASQLCAAIRGAYPIAQVLGHEHVAPGRKFDPGAGFDWQLLRRSLDWDPVFFRPKCKKIIRHVHVAGGRWRLLPATAAAPRGTAGMQDSCGHRRQNAAWVA